MPLSEFHQVTTKGKLESAQSKMTNLSSDLSTFMPDQEFVELLWENGQIVMQGQSNRPRKSSFINSMSSNTGRFHDRESRDAVIPKIAHFGATTDSMVNDFAPAVPSAPIGLNAQEDDMAPWMNYPIEDSLQNDYCSDFLSEFTGVHMNSHSTHDNAMPADRSNSFGQIVRDSQNVEHGHNSKAQAGGTESSRVRTSQLLQLPQQCQSSVSSTKSKTVEFGIASCFSTHQDPSGNLQDRSMKKQDVGTSKPPQPSSGMGLMNFSHFSRPVALVRSNLQSVDRLRRQEKASPAASSNPMEYTVNNSVSGSKSLLMIQSQSASIPPKMELRSSAKPPPEVVSVGQSGAICHEDTCRDKQINNITNVNTKPPDPVNCQSSSAAADVSLVRHEIEKGPEAVVASSVCSVNSAGAESNDPKHTAKRKNCEGEDSGYQSEDVEDGSVGVKKHAATRGTSTKRSRAAEVHNLSERRRRDRINEKMRALQELIPNCNKVDKASMLDEAIEYLKTLQLQVQIMSMGSGLCMPPMMLPAGMQHLRPHPMAHFSPMGVNMGMGMGLGYGMGMLDMNGSPGCPLIPVQPMHGSQFPCSSMPGAPSLHGMIPGSTNLHMYGIPGQGLPVSMPRAPAFGSVSGLSAKVNTVPQISGTTTTPLPVADTAPSSSSKDQEQQNIKLETKTSASDSQIQTSTQVAKESFEQTTLLQMSNQTLHGSGN